MYIAVLALFHEFEWILSKKKHNFFKMNRTTQNDRNKLIIYKIQTRNDFFFK